MRDLIKAIKAWIAMIERIFKPIFDTWINGVKTWWSLIVLGGLQEASADSVNRHDASKTDRRCFR